MRNVRYYSRWWSCSAANIFCVHIYAVDPEKVIMIFFQSVLLKPEALSGIIMLRKQACGIGLFAVKRALNKQQEVIMEKYKQEFIEFMVDCQVLKFGDFVTKSGRKTPFFVNTGFYRTGAQLRRLGGYYAEAIKNSFGLDFDVLFGPAYKGIPLSVAATVAISEKYDKDIRYCSNRKEIKDHGDKGILLGSPISDGDKVVIIEDVTTAGTSIEETLPIIKAQGDVNVCGLVVSVDRMERGKGEKSALSEIEEKYGLKTTAIVTMAEVIEHLYNKEYKGKVIIDDTLKAAIDAYYATYGAVPALS